MSSGLRTRANELAESDHDASAVLDLLSQTVSMVVRSGDWNNPYAPMMSLQGQRTMIPDDLTDEQCAFLSAALQELDHPTLGARIADLLFLRSSGKQRVEYAKTGLALWMKNDITADTWFHFSDEWERFATVAKRLGKATALESAEIERTLLAFVLSTSSGNVAARIAALLRSLGLASHAAAEMAERLAALAPTELESPHLARGIHQEASEWFTRAGDTEAATLHILRQAESLVTEADERGTAAGGSALVENSLLEKALQTLRRIPRPRRTTLGAEKLAIDLIRRIRDSGAAGLTEMKEFVSEPMDLTEGVREAVERVRDRDLVTALRNFTSLIPFPSYANELTVAEASVVAHPLQSLFSTVTYSSDGRTVNRGGDPDAENKYGVADSVWRQMMLHYTLRVSLTVRGAIWPAFVQLTNEHHLSVRDFEAIVSGSGLVPSNRIQLYARGLYLGYDGDFASAIHLLVPQIENLIRYHLREAGVPTSNVDQDGIESERGLSSLMELEDVVDLLTEDLAFEIRALFCGPLGPNLRNEIAHGLLSDNQVSGPEAIYTWWFALKLAFHHYWNNVRSTAEENETEAGQGEAV